MIKELATELVDLKRYTTFRMGGKARYFFVAQTVENIREACRFATEHNLPVFILGEGSNILFAQDDVYEGVVIKNEILEFDILEENSDSVILKIGAGENWDSVVARTVEKNWSGIEALSWIPGTAGATPIQNVGAYGAEIADVLVSLEAYEISSGQIHTFTNAECEFKYRDSIFKNQAKDRFIITFITIKLSKQPAVLPSYPGVKKYFEEHKNEFTAEQPTQAQIRQAIIQIRNIKLPDPKEVASVGSFFKNPFVDKNHYEELKKQHPEIVAYPTEEQNYKISAGWLLENIGVKGKQFGNLQFYPNNALVLTNIGNATFQETMQLVEEIKSRVHQDFRINLEIEPIIVK